MAVSALGFLLREPGTQSTFSWRELVVLSATCKSCLLDLGGLPELRTLAADYNALVLNIEEQQRQDALDLIQHQRDGWFLVGDLSPHWDVYSSDGSGSDGWGSDPS